MFVVKVPVVIWENESTQDTRTTYVPATTVVLLSRAMSFMLFVNCTGNACVVEKLTSCRPNVATRPSEKPPGPKTWAMYASESGVQPWEVRTMGAVVPVPAGGSRASVPRLPGGGSAAEADDVASATTPHAAAAAEPAATTH